MKTALQLLPASIADYPVIQNMARFYVYDMSAYLGRQKGWELPKSGLFESSDFKKYWQAEDTYPLIIRQGQEVAGFVIIDKKGSNPTINFNVAEFFILRKFQKKGFGREVALRCFEQLAGIWEVMLYPENAGAYRFWKKVIQEYTGGNFNESTKPVAHLKNHEKIVFQFDSRTKNTTDTTTKSISTTASPKQVAETYMNRVWIEKDLSAIDELVDQNVKIHSLLGEFGGFNEMKTVVHHWLHAFPNLEIANIHVIAEGDIAIVHWKAAATHLGEFNGIQATGKSILYAGVTIYRINNGKITEYWAYLDMQQLIRQII